MTCVTCGTVGPAGATWCPSCYLPYVRAGSSIPPQGFAPPPAPVATAYAVAAAYAPPAYAPPANPFAAPPPGYGAPSFQPPPMMYAPQSWPANLGLVVPEYAVATGDLPRICVVTGQPTQNMVAMRWLWAPAWTAIFVLVGILPYFFVRLIAGDKAAGYLPLLPAVRSRQQWMSWGGLAAFLVGLVTMIGGFGAGTALVGFAGLVLMISGIYAIGRQGRTVVVKRASPGYLALPNAHPNFVAAFQTGRPAQQVPYSTVPRVYKTGKVAIALAVVLVLIFSVAMVSAFVVGDNCLASHVHPGVAAVDQEFARSEGEVARINAEDGGQGLTPNGLQELVAEHSRLMADLDVIHVSVADRNAINSYEMVMRDYDRVMTAGTMGAAGDSDRAAAAAQLTTAAVNLDNQLRAVPASCSGN